MQTGSSDLNRNPPTPEPAGNTTRSCCVCGVCKEMPDEQENVCCRKRTCVTSYVMCNSVSLDQKILQFVIRARCDIRVEEPTVPPTVTGEAPGREEELRTI